jgi:hypothetical protein
MATACPVPTLISNLKKSRQLIERELTEVIVLLTPELIFEDFQAKEDFIKKNRSNAPIHANPHTSI